MNRKTASASVLGALLAGLALGCGARSERSERSAQAELGAAAPERAAPAALGGITRVHTCAGVLLASQPAPEDFERARQQGVKTVINLRRDEEVTDFDERAVVTGLGLTYVSLPFGGADDLTDAIFDRARELFDTAERPILVHCASANRVGAVWLPWRVLDGGLSSEAALAEARQIGLKGPALEAKALDYVARHGG